MQRHRSVAAFRQKERWPCRVNNWGNAHLLTAVVFSTIPAARDRRRGSGGSMRCLPNPPEARSTPAGAEASVAGAPPGAWLAKAPEPPWPRLGTKRAAPPGARSFPAQGHGTRASDGGSNVGKATKGSRGPPTAAVRLSGYRDRGRARDHQSGS